MVVASLIICFGIVGVIYRIWSNQIAELEKRRTQEKVRQTELAAVKAQNEKYQQRQNDYERRVKSIDALQSGRVGPVELMNALGSVVNKTTDVYLFTLAPTGDRVQLKGQSGSVESMANFLAYLKNSGTFDDIQLEQFFQDDQKDRVAYKFTLNCQFRSPTGGTSPTAGAAPGAATGGPGGPGTPPPQRPAQGRASL
jgi:Tfp pilus assembly protein PilN